MRRLPHYLLPLVVGLYASGCRSNSNPQDAPERVSVVDGLGRTVSVPSTVERIVPLSPSTTEVVFAAGAGDLVVGVSIADDFPPEVARLPRFNAYPLDLETIVGLNPDLLIASDQVNHPAQVEALERIGIPAYFLASQTFQGIPETIRLIGRLLDSEEQAEVAADSLERRIEALAAVTSGIDEPPDVLLLAGADPLYSFGTESYVHELIRMAGGRSATESLQTATPVLSDEFVLRAMPDVIIGTDSTLFTPEAILQIHPTWDVVPAVTTGRVYAVDPDLIYRPGPRLVEGAFRIARLLHPDLNLPDDQ